jgi:putative DNA primase/helicase
MIGKVVDNTIILVEGYATGASVHQATGQAVLVSFDAGNLKPVAELVRAKRPDMKIIIAADDDHANEANPGLTKATEAARIVGGLLAVPVFPGTRGAKDTDLNDLHRLAGEEAVKACIEAAAPATGTPSTTTEATGEQWPEPIPLPEGLPPVKPLDPAMIPAPLRGWLMDIADRMQIPPDFSTAAAVVALGSIIGRGCGIHPKRHDDWLVIPNLWGGVIGRPSLMKTPAIAEAQRHLTRLESEAREEHQTAAGSYEIEKEVLKLTKSAISDKINRRLKKATTLKNCGGNWQLCKRANLHGDATRRKTAPPRNWGSY